MRQKKESWRSSGRLARATAQTASNPAPPPSPLSAALPTPRCDGRANSLQPKNRQTTTRNVPVTSNKRARTDSCRNILASQARLAVIPGDPAWGSGCWLLPGIQSRLILRWRSSYRLRRFRPVRSSFITREMERGGVFRIFAAAETRRAQSSRAATESREAFGVRAACRRFFARPNPFKSGSKLTALQTLRDKSQRT